MLICLGELWSSRVSDVSCVRHEVDARSFGLVLDPIPPIP